MSESVPQKRQVERRRVLKAGVVIAKDGFLTFRCTVRDISDTGARLIVEDPKGIPEHFDLLIELDGLRFACRAVRYNGNEIGVHFIGPPRQVRPLRSQVVVSSSPEKPTLRRKPREA